MIRTPLSKFPPSHQSYNDLISHISSTCSLCQIPFRYKLLLTTRLLHAHTCQIVSLLVHMQDCPVFFCVVTRYRPCLSQTFLSRRIPGDHLSLLSRTTNPAITLAGFCVRIPVAAWRSPSTTLHRFPASLPNHSSACSFTLPLPS